MQDFLSKLIEKDIHIDISEGELFVRFPKNRTDTIILEEIKSRKQTIIEYLNNLKEITFINIPVLTNAKEYAISDSQRRLWVLSQFEESSVAYNIPGSIYLNEEVDVEKFKRAIESTIDRHEILRTVFKANESEEIRQWVLRREDLAFKIDYKDLRKEKNKEEKVKVYIEEDSYKTFDLEKGPLLRVSLLQVEDKKYVFYFNMHHIISDGWSMEVLRKDVFCYYEAYKLNKQPDLKELRIQYKDYSSWQLAQAEKESFKDHKNYWLNNLSGELPLLDLLSVKRRPRVKTNNGRGLSTYIDSSTTDNLKKYTEENGGSLFMGLLAAWNVLIYHYTGQKDIIIGTPVAGREHADLEDQIGFYVNTLALRNELKPEESFSEFYSRLKENTLTSYNHQRYPFDRLVEELSLQRDASRSAVFDVMLTLQNNDGEDTKGVELKEEEQNQVIDQGYKASKFDMELFIEETGNYLFLELIYNSDVYEGEMVEGLLRHYKQLLRSLVYNPEENIAQIDYLSEEEKQELMFTFNNTEVAYPKDKTIVDLFEEQVLKTPDHIAIVFEDKEFSYKEINEQSNQLARYLKKNYKILGDDLVGIEQDRSEWMIISILGVLKSGGAYVPIDPSYPQERINYIKKDIKCKLCLDKNELNNFKKNQKRYSKEKINASIQSNNLAYVIYTSGSTGRPKGVMIEHSGLVNRLLWMGRDLQIGERDVFLQKTPITFDVSVWELFLPFISGSRLVVAKPDGHKDPFYIEQVIKDHQVSIIHFVPSMLSGMLEHIQWNKFESLRHLVCSGEALTKKIEEAFKEKSSAQLHNYYGPTEASVDVTAINLSQFPTSRSEVSIGKPVDNTSIFIVNEMNMPQPVGVLGEILIGGVQLARGYLNKGELTEEKFIESPFKAGERLYKTGDLGRWLPDGSIEYVGRKDDQIKIRGYRIELGEIEHALLKNEDIKEAVVLALENQNKEKELVAYITSNEEQNINELRSYLKEFLPEYMLPVYYVQLDTLPLTSNGKIDRKSLPNPEGLGLSSGVEYVAPKSTLEKKLVKIWEEVLQRENIGVKDDFFALGGHSLKAVRLSNKYEKELGVKVSLKDLLTDTTVESQAVLIQTFKKNEFIQIEKIAHQSSYSISAGQRRLWVLSQFEESSITFNMSGSIYLNEEVDLISFKRAIDSTIDRHEILRTVFIGDENGEIQQRVLKKEALDFKIDYKDLRKEKNKEEQVKAYINEDIYKVFDLERGPLLRASVLQLEEERYVFYFNMHHIISDGWSMEVLRKDVFSYYEAYKENKEPELKPLRIHYKDYSAWQLEQLEEESFKAHRSHWLESLRGDLPLLDLPSTKKRPRIKTYNGQGLSTYIDQDTTIKLRAYSQENGGSLFMVLLSVWNVLMYRYSGGKDIIIGSPTAGRGHLDLEDQIGFYVNTLALRNEINPEESFDSFYKRLKENTLKGYSHQMYPFDRLVEELEVQRDTSRSAVFDVMLVLQNTGDKVEGDTLKEEELNQVVELGFTPSKFDIDISIQEVGDYLSLHIAYNSDVYDGEMVKGLIRHYKQLVQAVLVSPEDKISEIDYLLESEKQELLVTFNDRLVDYPKDKTIVDLFAEQVAKTPDNIAILFEEKELSYKELDELSNQLGRYLKKNYAIEPDDLICIKQERSEWMIVSILAVLKSGGAYVPIDPEYPKERIEYIEKDTKCKVCIDEKELTNFKESQASYSKKKATCNIHTYDLAYVIYTSGSTGRPKGVMVEHSNIVSFMPNVGSAFGWDSVKKIAASTNLTFDISLLEIFGALCHGKELIILSKDELIDPHKFLEAIDKYNVEGLQLTPSRLSQIYSVTRGLPKSISSVLIGGELLNDFLYRSLKKEPFTSINVYGPTETTIWSTSLNISDSEKLSIGNPLPNEQFYILNEEKALQPIGVTGEICIGGAGVARGYLNQEALTSERFIANPFKSGERLYKTGDLGRWLPDGNIEYIGRIDNQVKIRGYRIELEEIEHALQSHNEIEEAVVLAKENGQGEKELVAYITSKSQQNTNGLKGYLKELLPVYMLPAYFVQLKSLPLTGNGKIDKKALPDIQSLGIPSGVEYMAPRNDIEERLVKIWQEVLQRENIGIKDDFFNLGGHSLKAMTILKIIHKEFSVKIKIKEVFDKSTIELMGEIINREMWIQKNMSEEETILESNDETFIL